MNALKVLANARTVNAFVRTSGEEDCEVLLRYEKLGKARLRVMLRIHSRLNKVRADRERLEIMKAAGTSA